MNVRDLIYALLLFATVAGMAIGISLYFQPEQSKLGVTVIIGSALLAGAGLISGLNDAYDFVGKVNKVDFPRYDQTQERQYQETEISSFPVLAKALWPLMAANGRAFMSFGPNSGADNAADLRWDMKLWESAKIDTIVPNNRKMLELINKNQGVIPSQYRAVFDKMITHIYAFEKHCEDPTFSYSEHQFPQKFAQIVDQTCAQEEKRQGNTTQYEQWLNRWFQETDQVNVVDAYLAGSSLRGDFPNSDVDIFVLTSSQNTTSDENLVAVFDTLKNDFFAEFEKPLHIMVFSSSERLEFYEFLGNLTLSKQFDQFRGDYE